MSNWEGFLDDSSELDSGGTSSASGTGRSVSQNDLSPQRGEQGGTAASRSSGIGQRLLSAVHTSSPSTKSTGSDGISRTPCGGSLCSHPPRGLALRAPADTVPSGSGLNDSIPEHFASCTPPSVPTASPIGQILEPGSPSSSAGRTGSAETYSRGTEVIFGLGSENDDTPPTTEASQDAANIVADLGGDDHAAGIADEVSFLGLEFPGELSMLRIRCLGEY
jgi:hypothetical protein